MLYNPGELSSWFFVPGVLGAALTLTATLVASASVLRERESGTMEQLLMTPAEDWEILLAKFIPLAVCLLSDVLIAIVSSRLIFALPFRGDVFLFTVASVLYVTIGIGVGMLLGTLCTSQRQAQLTSFFVNIPLIVLSGTVVPYETMPPFLQSLSLIDPLRYYTIIARGVILKGADFSMLWQDLSLLAFFAILIIGASMNRFRKQLA
jgi:ABC-2 type transport system permease protein